MKRFSFFNSLPSGVPHRFIGAALCAVYLSTQVVFAHAAEKNYWQERRQTVQMARAQAAAPSFGPESVPVVKNAWTADTAADPLLAPLQNSPYLKMLPLAFGTVRDVSVPAGKIDRLVVHIQDVHGQAEAQKNIAQSILTMSASRQGRVVVGLEAAAGPLLTEALRAFPDRGILGQVADIFLEKNILTGAEVAGLTAPDAPLLWGVEDEKLYSDHVKAMRDSLPLEKSLHARLNGLAQTLDGLKARHYTPALKSWDAEFTRYHEDRGSLGAYVRHLAGTGVPAGKNVRTFLQALDQEESLNFKKAEAERTALVQVLARALPARELDGLIEASLAFRSGATGYGAFYARLETAARAGGVSLSRYPEFSRYVKYVSLVESIDKRVFLDETAALEDASAEKVLAQAPRVGRDVYRMSRDLNLARRLVRRALTQDDWSAYQKREAEIRGLAGRIGGTTDAAAFAADLAVFEKFYTAGVDRNQAMVDNLLSQIKGDSPLAVLVAGGFHTEGMQAILKKKGIAYVTMTPRMGKIGEGDFLDVFRQDKTPLEQLFSGEKLSLNRGLVLNQSERMDATGGRQYFLGVAIGVLVTRALALGQATIDQIRAFLQGLGAAAGADYDFEAETRDGRAGYLLGVKLKGAAYKIFFWMEKSGRPVQTQNAAEFSDGAKVFFSPVSRTLRPDTGTGLMPISARGVWPLALVPALIAAWFFFNLIFQTDSSAVVRLVSLASGAAFLFLGHHLWSLSRKMDRIESEIEAAQVIESHPSSRLLGQGTGRYVGDLLVDAAVRRLAQYDPYFKVIRVHPEFLKFNFFERAFILVHESWHAAGLKAEGWQHVLVYALQVLPLWAPAVGAGAAWLLASAGIVASPGAIVIGAVIGFLIGAVLTIGVVMRAPRRQSVTDKEKNLDTLWDIIENSEGPQRVLAIVNKGDGASMRSQLNGNSDVLFRADRQTRVMAHEEVVRRGQFFGLLDASDAWIEKFGDDFDENDVVLGGMFPGQGTRFGPFTIGANSVKPFFPAPVSPEGTGQFVTAADASLFSWTLMVHRLRQLGFRGVAWKWGDEPQISQILMANLEGDFSDVDTVRFGSEVKVTPELKQKLASGVLDEEITRLNELAIQKEWILIDAGTGDLVHELHRRPLRELIDIKEELEAERGIKIKMLTHTGSPALSSVFRKSSRIVFGDHVEGWMDIDGYVFDALSQPPEFWNREVEKETARVGAGGKSGLIDLLKDYPDFYERIQILKVVMQEMRKQKKGQAYDREFIERYQRLIGAAYESPAAKALAVKAFYDSQDFQDKFKNVKLEARVVNIGEDPYWADMGQLHRARETWWQMNDRNTAAGAFARKIARIDHIAPDEFGNIAFNSSYPKDGSVRNCVLINASIDQVESYVEGAVIANSRLGVARIAQGCVVTFSTMRHLTMEQNSFAWEAKGEFIQVPREYVHTTIVANPHDPSRGFEQWRAPARVFDEAKGQWLPIDIGKGDLYEKPQYGNPQSFKGKFEDMRQRDVPAALIRDANKAESERIQKIMVSSERTVNAIIEGESGFTEELMDLVKFDYNLTLEEVLVDVWLRLHRGRAMADENLRENAREFFEAVRSYAIGLQSPERSRNLQTIAQQALNILSWIDQNVTGSAHILLTTDPGRMLKGKDKNGQSFLDRETLPVPAAQNEGEPGAFWRGVEDFTKVEGSLAPALMEKGATKAEVAANKRLFETAKKSYIAYTMNHGHVAVPNALRALTESGAVSTWHNTAFLHTHVPGTRQAASTGVGHFQGKKLDIKQVVEGKIIQVNVKYNKAGEIEDVIYQIAEAGDYTVALPGYYDYVMSVGDAPAVFNDISVDLEKLYADEPERLAKALERFRGGVQPDAEPKAAPFLWDIDNGVLVRSGNAAVKFKPGFTDARRIEGPQAAIFPEENLLGVYEGASPESLKAVVKSLIGHADRTMASYNDPKRKALTEKFPSFFEIFKSLRMPSSFGTSGVRGAADVEATDFDVYTKQRGFIRAARQRLEQEGKPLPTAFAIGGDLRGSSERIMLAVARAAADEGFEDIVNLGDVPTPVLALHCFTHGMMGAMVTASHNPIEPFEQNGVKNYFPTREAMKEDELLILAGAAQVEAEFLNNPEMAREMFLNNERFRDNDVVAFTEEDVAATYGARSSDTFSQAEELFIKRNTEALGDTLRGMSVFVSEHSSVGRRINNEILRRLGVKGIPVGDFLPKGQFRPLDTENLDPEYVAALQKMLAKNPEVDAAISWDGDADRPIVIHRGGFLQGQDLNILSALYLNADAVVIRVGKSDGAIDYLNKLNLPIRLTEVGSPHLLKAMSMFSGFFGFKRVIGWEDNGGLMLESDFDLGDGRRIGALPTRDATLPTLIALAHLRRERERRGNPNLQLGDIMAEIHTNGAAAGLVKEFPRADARAIVAHFTPKLDDLPLDKTKEKLKDVFFNDDGTVRAIANPMDDAIIAEARAAQGNEARLREIRDRWLNGRPMELTQAHADFLTGVKNELEGYFQQAEDSKEWGSIYRLQYVDGVKIYFKNKGSMRVFHFRPSGNADEFRNYTQAHLINEISGAPLTIAQNTAEAVKMKDAGVAAKNAGGHLWRLASVLPGGRAAKSVKTARMAANAVIMINIIGGITAAGILLYFSHTLGSLIAGLGFLAVSAVTADIFSRQHREETDFLRKLADRAAGIEVENQRAEILGLLIPAFKSEMAFQLGGEEVKVQLNWRLPPGVAAFPDGRSTIQVNPVMMSLMTPEQQAQALEHELRHMALRARWPFLARLDHRGLVWMIEEVLVSLGDLNPANREATRVPVNFQAAALGSWPEIQRLMRAFQNTEKSDAVLKPWIAKALNTPQARRVLEYQQRLDHEDAGAWGETLTQMGAVWDYGRNMRAAIDEAVTRGGVTLAPTNFRTDADGFGWGVPARLAPNLRRMGLFDEEGRVVEGKQWILDMLSLTPETIIAEDWKNSDDVQYPDWFFIVINGEEVPVPLFMLVDQAPDQVIGKKRLAAIGAALGSVCKDLMAWVPLSWQWHPEGIAEGYLVKYMGPGTGLFFGPNEQLDANGNIDAAANRRLVRRFRNRVLNGVHGDNRTVLIDKTFALNKKYKEKNKGQVEIPAMLAKAVQDHPHSPVLIREQYIRDFLAGFDENISIPDLVEYAMRNGVNVIDLVGPGLDEATGKFVDVQGNLLTGEDDADHSASLVQIIQPKPGDLIVTGSRVPHGLSGNRHAYGENAFGHFFEFKALPKGNRYAAGETKKDTVAFADNQMGKDARPGKVTVQGFESALEASQRTEGESGSAFWRIIRPSDYATHGQRTPVRLEEGIAQRRIHKETHFASLEITMAARKGGAPGQVRLKRYGQHSALFVEKGRVAVKDRRGRTIAVAGFAKGGWDGDMKKSDKALIFAKHGDVTLEQLGDEEVVLYDTVSPVKGVPLPEAVGIHGVYARAAKSAASAQLVMRLVFSATVALPVAALWLAAFAARFYFQLDALPYVTLGASSVILATVGWADYWVLTRYLKQQAVLLNRHASGAVPAFDYGLAPIFRAPSLEKLGVKIHQSPALGRDVALVTVGDDAIYINEEFLRTRNFDEQMELLEHELRHVRLRRQRPIFMNYPRLLGWLEELLVSLPELGRTPWGAPPAASEPDWQNAAWGDTEAAQRVLESFSFQKAQSNPTRLLALAKLLLTPSLMNVLLAEPSLAGENRIRLENVRDFYAAIMSAPEAVELGVEILNGSPLAIDPVIKKVQTGGREVRRSNVLMFLGITDEGGDVADSKAMERHGLRVADKISELQIASDDPSEGSSILLPSRRSIRLGTALILYGDRMLGPPHVRHYGASLGVALRLVDHQAPEALSVNVTSGANGVLPADIVMPRGGAVDLVAGLRNTLSLAELRIVHERSRLVILERAYHGGVLRALFDKAAEHPNEAARLETDMPLSEFLSSYDKAPFLEPFAIGSDREAIASHLFDRRSAYAAINMKSLFRAFKDGETAFLNHLESKRTNEFENLLQSVRLGDGEAAVIPAGTFRSFRQNPNGYWVWTRGPRAGGVSKAPDAPAGPLNTADQLLDGAIQAIDHLPGPTAVVYHKFDIDAARRRAKPVLTDEKGNELSRIAGAGSAVVDEYRVRDRIAVKPTGRGFPLLVVEGQVDLIDRNGNAHPLSRGQTIFIHPGMGTVHLQNKDGAPGPAVLRRWYAPVRGGDATWLIRFARAYFAVVTAVSLAVIAGLAVLFIAQLIFERMRAGGSQAAMIFGGLNMQFFHRDADQALSTPAAAETPSVPLLALENLIQKMAITEREKREFLIQVLPPLRSFDIGGGAAFDPHRRFDDNMREAIQSEARLSDLLNVLKLNPAPHAADFHAVDPLANTAAETLARLGLAYQQLERDPHNARFIVQFRDTYQSTMKLLALELGSQYAADGASTVEREAALRALLVQVRVLSHALNFFWSQTQEGDGVTFDGEAFGFYFRAGANHRQGRETHLVLQKTDGFLIEFRAAAVGQRVESFDTLADQIRLRRALQQGDVEPLPAIDVVSTDIMDTGALRDRIADYLRRFHRDLGAVSDKEVNVLGGTDLIRTGIFNQDAQQFSEAALLAYKNSALNGSGMIVESYTVVTSETEKASRWPLSDMILVINLRISETIMEKYKIYEIVNFQA